MEDSCIIRDEDVDELNRLIHGICNRPEMYTGERRFFTVFSFIFGFCHGKGEPFLVIFNRFGLWIVEEIFPEESLSENFSSILFRKFPDENLAIRKLLEYWEQFHKNFNEIKSVVDRNIPD